MGTRYQLMFRMFDDEKQAAAFCAGENQNATYYMRKNHPANYTPLTSQYGERFFVAWHYQR